MIHTLGKQRWRYNRFTQQMRRACLFTQRGDAISQEKLVAFHLSCGK